MPPFAVLVPPLFRQYCPQSMAPIHGQFGQFIVWLSLRVRSVGRWQGDEEVGALLLVAIVRGLQRINRKHCHDPAYNHSPLFLSLAYK